jgi:hypothetical protein
MGGRAAIFRKDLVLAVPVVSVGPVLTRVGRTVRVWDDSGQFGVQARTVHISRVRYWRFYWFL